LHSLSPDLTFLRPSGRKYTRLWCFHTAANIVKQVAE